MCLIHTSFLQFISFQMKIFQRMHRAAKNVNLKRLNAALLDSSTDESAEVEKANDAKRSKTTTESIDFDDDALIEKNSKMRLKDDFFDFDVHDMSKRLLGKFLVRVVPVAGDAAKGNQLRKMLVGKIVETEIYHSKDDASHSYELKQTDRNRAMFMKAGTSYVYNCYGMYACFNVSSKDEGGGVLIRALEPVHGIETMKKLRCSNKPNLVSKMKVRELTN